MKHNLNSEETKKDQITKCNSIQLDLNTIIISHLKQELRQKQIGFALFEAFCEPNYQSILELQSDHEVLFNAFNKRNEVYAEEYWIWMDEETDLDLQIRIKEKESIMDEVKPFNAF